MLLKLFPLKDIFGLNNHSMLGNGDKRLLAGLTLLAMNRKILVKYLFLVIMQFLCCSECFGQGEKVDSLKKLLPVLKDTSLVNCLNQLCSSYIEVHTDSALLFASKAMLEAERINYEYGKAQAYYNLGFNERLVGTYPTMEEYSANAVALLKGSKRHKDELLLTKSYELLGFSKWAQSKFDEALASYKNAEKLAIKIGNEGSLGYLYGAMTALETQRGQYKNSLEYCIKGLPLWKKPSSDPRGFIAMSLLYSTTGDYKTALDYCREARDIAKIRGGTPRMYTYIGETFYLNKQYDSAIFYYQLLRNHNKKLVSVSGMTDDFKQNSWPNSRMAEIFIARGQYDTAISHLSNALIYFERINDRNQVMWTLLRLVKAYDSTRNYSAALYNARKLLRIANEVGARQYIRDAHAMLYTLFDAQRNNDSAYHHLRLYTALKETIDADQAEQKLAIFRSEIETEKAQAGIARLTKEKQLQELQLNQYLFQKYALVVCIILLLVIGLIVFRNILLKRKSERHQRELAENELKMQTFENARTKAEFQQQAAELEMQALRAQMNPHFIFNSLNSINRFILQNNSEQASEYLIKFSKLVRLILQNAQSSLIALESELESLELYLELEALRLEHKFDYKIILPKDLDLFALKVPPLIIQPYAENAIWHGLAHKEEKGHLEINVNEENGYLFFRITDDGIGRNKSALLSNAYGIRKKSLGSKITADRIAMMHGNGLGVTINDLVSSEGKAVGTEVIVKISVNYD
jgi:tetratricopeptide (TPR) repeat protein